MIPLAIHQLKKILRDLSSGSVKACGPFIVPWRCPGSTMGDPPLMPFDEGKWWRHMMLPSALDWDEYGMIGMFFGCFFVVFSQLQRLNQFDETLIFARWPTIEPSRWCSEVPRYLLNFQEAIGLIPGEIPRPPGCFWWFVFVYGTCAMEYEWFVDWFCICLYPLRWMNDRNRDSP